MQYMHHSVEVVKGSSSVNLIFFNLPPGTLVFNLNCSSSHSFFCMTKTNTLHWFITSLMLSLSSLNLNSSLVGHSHSSIAQLPHHVVFSMVNPS